MVRQIVTHYLSYCLRYALTEIEIETNFGGVISCESWSMVFDQ